MSFLKKNKNVEQIFVLDLVKYNILSLLVSSYIESYYQLQLIALWTTLQGNIEMIIPIMIVIILTIVIDDPISGLAESSFLLSQRKVYWME